MNLSYFKKFSIYKKIRKKYKKRPRREQLIIRVFVVMLVIYALHFFIPTLAINLNLLLLTIIGFLSNYYPPVGVISFSFTYIYLLLIGIIVVFALKELFYFMRNYHGIIKEEDNDDDDPFDEDEDIWNLKY